MHPCRTQCGRWASKALRPVPLGPDRGGQHGLWHSASAPDPHTRSAPTSRRSRRSERGMPGVVPCQTPSTRPPPPRPGGRHRHRRAEGLPRVWWRGRAAAASPSHDQRAHSPRCARAGTRALRSGPRVKRYGSGVWAGACVRPPCWPRALHRVAPHGRTVSRQRARPWPRPPRASTTGPPGSVPSPPSAHPWPRPPALLTLGRGPDGAARAPRDHRPPEGTPPWAPWGQHRDTVSRRAGPGVCPCADVPGLPRTNNAVARHWGEASPLATHGPPGAHAADAAPAGGLGTPAPSPARGHVPGGLSSPPARGRGAGAAAFCGTSPACRLQSRALQQPQAQGEYLRQQWAGLHPTGTE